MSDFAPDIREQILGELAAGESLKWITKQEGFPSEKTVMRWLAADEKFRTAYGEARALGMEKHANDIIDIADEASVEGVNVARLRVDARKWILAKMLPRKYGDSLALAGDAARGPLQVVLSNEDAGTL